MIEIRIVKEIVPKMFYKYLIVKIVDDGLDFYFHFSFFILFYFYFSFIFLFLEQLRLGSIGHAVTSVTSGGIVT